MNGQAAMERDQALAMLEWQAAMGVDEATGAEALGLYEVSRRHVEAKTSPRPAATASATTPSRAPAITQPTRPEARPMGGLGGAEAAARARAEAAEAKDMAALRAALERFDALSITQTATNLVFGDGNPQAPILVLGEAPGAEEDRVGRPFVGASGQLWDRMMGTIGLTREHYFISNILYWRPPGNRTPSDAEVAACLPFVWRMVELMRPRVVLLLGKAPAGAILDTTESISRMRGRWRTLERPGLDPAPDALATFHPAYLLRTPTQKKYAWRDLLALKMRLASLGLTPSMTGDDT